MLFGACGIGRCIGALLTLPDSDSRSGKDALAFVQGLVTNDTRLLERPNDAIFAAFLTPKGRTVAEATLSLAAGLDRHPTLLIDVDRSLSSTVIAHLSRYKLRRDVEITGLDASHAVFALPPLDPFAAVSGRGAGLEALERARHALAQQQSVGSSFVDPRSSRLGIRLVAPLGTDVAASLTASPISAHHYGILRLLLGVPEGLEVVDTLPTDWSIEQLGGVSFAKGCYVGQELVARTHFRGLVRRRYVPVLLEPPEAPSRPVLFTDHVAAARDVPGSHVASTLVMPSFVDDSWSGQVEIGQSVSPALDPDAISTFPENGSGSSGASTGSSDSAGERSGKIVAWQPRSNIALALLRVSWLPTMVAPQTTTVGNGSGRSAGGGHDGDELCSEGTLVAETADLRLLHECCQRAGPVHLAIVQPGSADARKAGAMGGDTESVPGVRTSASIMATGTPILPPFWRHVISRTPPTHEGDSPATATT